MMFGKGKVWNQKVIDYFNYLTKLQMMDYKIQGQPEDQIIDHLRHNDNLVCSIESLDIWVMVHIKMISEQRSLEVDLQVKLEKTMDIEDLKQVLQKISLQVWNTLCTQSDMTRSHIFILSKFQFTCVGCAFVDDSFNSTRRTSMATVGQSFTYNNSQVQVECIFRTIQDMFLEQNPQVGVKQSVQ